MSIEFNYYYGKEAEQFSFFRIPKLLFTDEVFKTLSSDAKVLYGILLDRMSLSMKNDWVDDENKVYIIFTVDEIERTMNFGKNKSINTMKELERFGLIEKKRRGLGKPNILYVKSFVVETENNKHIEVSNENSQRFKNQTSRNPKNKLQEVSNSNSNKTNINKTDNSDTEYNNTPPYPLEFETKKLTESRLVEEVKEKIKVNICFDDLVNANPSNKAMLDVIVSLMEDVLKSKKDFRINGKLCKNQDVKNIYLTIRKNHIEYILDYLSENKAKITNLRAYLTSLIYNAPLNVLSIGIVNRDNQSENDYYKNDKDIWREFLNGS